MAKVICPEAEKCRPKMCNHKKPHHRVDGKGEYGGLTGCSYVYGCLKRRKPACVEAPR